MLSSFSCGHSWFTLELFCLQPEFRVFMKGKTVFIGHQPMADFRKRETTSRQLMTVVLQLHLFQLVLYHP
ncbi:unnamed protein product [Linum trigynum]|uniref:Uncharacterized protein n=1 Tax=Linum trigynum TaxID=586398 RepID=A0AAV2FPL3_9ROSI